MPYGTTPPPHPPPQGGRESAGAPKRHNWTLAGSALAVILAGAAFGQQPRPSIFELQLGTPVRELPEEEFVDPACGTNGGPPGLRLDRLAAVARRPPEAPRGPGVWVC